MSKIKSKFTEYNTFFSRGLHYAQVYFTTKDPTLQKFSPSWLVYPLGKKPKTMGELEKRLHCGEIKSVE